MKRSKIRLLSVLLAMTVACSIASCEDNSRHSSGDDDEEETTTVEETEESSVESETTEVSETTGESETSEEPETTEQTTETAASPSDVQAFPSDNEYAPFIEDLRAAMTDESVGWYYGPGVDEDTAEGSEGLVLIEMRNAGCSHCYLLDLDGDGDDELLLAEPMFYDELSEDYMIWGAVSHDDTGYHILGGGFTRSTMQYMGNGYFYTDGSAGAAYHVNSIRRYDPSSESFETVCTMFIRYSEDASQIDYFYFDGDMPDTFSYDTPVSDEYVCNDEAVETMSNLVQSICGGDLYSFSGEQIYDYMFSDI